MSKIVTNCPACEGKLVVSRLSCTSCGVQLEGNFEIPTLLSLSPSDLKFALDFVRSSGSLKKMASIEGQSYPTIRNRLNEIISKLENSNEHNDLKQTQILDAIASGTMTAAEGAALLKGLKQ